MKPFIYWIYFFSVSIIGYRFTVTPTVVKNFNITFDKSFYLEKMNKEMNEKCFAICSNNATSIRFIWLEFDDEIEKLSPKQINKLKLIKTIVVQIITDNVTKINIPVIEDITAIVYYKCANQLTKGGPGKSEYYTFQKLCGDRTEKCKKLSNSFDRQWFSLKTGQIPKIYVNFSLPSDAKSIKIKIQTCTTERMMFPFKVQNKSINLREQYNSYNYTNNTFTAENLERMPISLSIGEFDVGVLADIEFNVQKINLEKCSSVNLKYCGNLCSNNKMKAGTKCMMKIKNQEMLIENRNTNCSIPENFMKSYSNKKVPRNKIISEGLCEFYNSKNISACYSICINLPNCSFMCLYKKFEDFEETGYKENVLRYYLEGPIGSGRWSYENIPRDLVYVNECAASPKLCLSNNSCIDEPIGYKCTNDAHNGSHCLEISHNRFWNCPIANNTISNNTTNETNINQLMIEKAEETFAFFKSIVNKSLSGDAKLNILMKETRKLSNNFKNVFTKVDVRQKKNTSRFLLRQIEKYVDQIFLKELDMNQTSLTRSSEEYDAYTSYIDETENEHVIPFSENKTHPEPLFVKLKLQTNGNIQTSEKLITTFIRFKDLDLIDESKKAELKIQNSSELKLKDDDVVERFKNSDFISLSLNHKRNVTIQFKLPTFQKVQSQIWLYSFEEECGYLADDKNWEWSVDGCRKVIESGNQFYCECDHLSNFAMLFSVKTVNVIHLTIFKYLSVFGTIINILSLVFFLTFVLWINSRDKLRLDQLNIAICLLLGTIAFSLGSVVAVNQIFCQIVAIFTQFLFLSAFVWKLILGINVVRMIASLRYQNEDWMVKYRLVTLGVGYGIPLVIVIISGSIYWSAYGSISDDVCWIKSSSKAFLTFIIPIGIILAVNLIALFFIGNALIRNYLDTRKTKVNESNELMVFMQLFASMGLTWLPSYFATVYLVAMYMWVLFFPLQGLMMFLFVVVINRENREKVSSFVIEKYSSLISKSTSSSDTRTHSKSKSTTHSKVTEHNQSLLSETEKDMAFPMIKIPNHDDTTIPLKNPVC